MQQYLVNQNTLKDQEISRLKVELRRSEVKIQELEKQLRGDSQKKVCGFSLSEADICTLIIDILLDQRRKRTLNQTDILVLDSAITNAHVTTSAEHADIRVEIADSLQCAQTLVDVRSFLV